MRHLNGWRLSAAAVGTAALAAGAFGLPAVLSNDTTDPAPIEITTVGETGGPVDDVDARTPADVTADTGRSPNAEPTVPSSTSVTSTTSLVSAASSVSPISLNSPDEPSTRTSTASAGDTGPSPTTAPVDSPDSPSSPDSPASIDSPSSIDS
jgi:hypothetical protein